MQLTLEGADDYTVTFVRSYHRGGADMGLSTCSALLSFVLRCSVCVTCVVLCCCLPLQVLRPTSVPLSYQSLFSIRANLPRNHWYYWPVVLNVAMSPGAARAAHCRGRVSPVDFSGLPGLFPDGATSPRDLRPKIQKYVTKT